MSTCTGLTIEQQIARCEELQISTTQRSIQSEQQSYQEGTSESRVLIATRSARGTFKKADLLAPARNFESPAGEHAVGRLQEPWRAAQKHTFSVGIHDANMSIQPGGRWSGDARGQVTAPSNFGLYQCADNMGTFYCASLAEDCIFNEYLAPRIHDLNGERPWERGCRKCCLPKAFVVPDVLVIDDATTLQHTSNGFTGIFGSTPVQRRSASASRQPICPEGGIYEYLAGASNLSVYCMLRKDSADL